MESTHDGGPALSLDLGFESAELLWADALELLETEKQVSAPLELDANQHKKKNARKNNRDAPIKNTKKNKKKQKDVDAETEDKDELKDSPTMLIRVNRVAWTTAQARFPGMTAAATFEHLITECNPSITSEAPYTLRRAIIDLQRITAELELLESCKSNHSINHL